MQKQRRMMEFIITCIIAVIVLGGAVFQGWKKMKSEQEANVSDSLRRKAENELRDLQKQQLVKQSHLLEKADLIIRDNQNVIKRQEETLKNINGFGFPIVTVGRNNDRDIKIMISNSGGYPIRNLIIDAVDWTNGLKEIMVNNTIRRSQVLLNTKFSDKYLIMAGLERRILPISFNNITALELKLDAEHASFVSYVLLEYDKQSDKVICHYKTFEVNRKDGTYTLIDTTERKKNSRIDQLMNKYFYLKRYYILEDV